ncbi:MAG: acyltransferase [Burkholderiaceae bacterium]|nr:acyltransferase [Burkholderiaceae bacterium]
MSKDNRFDILRLFAAWLVLFNHAYPLAGLAGADPLTLWLKIDTSGGLGVAIFFAVSGYLVTISLQNSRSLEDFLRRRVLRIYPALVAVTLICMLVLGPLVTTLPLRGYFSSGASWNYLETATGLKIIYALPGVFEGNPARGAVNGSLWSLPIELRCYIALAVLSLLPLSIRIKALLAVGVLSMLMMARPLVPPASVATPFFELDYYDTKLGLMFAIGASLAAWRERLNPLAWHAMGVMALLVLVVAWVLPFGVPQLFLYTAAIPVFILWLALYGKFLPQLPQRMGDWSYGTYLYAFPIQQLLTQYQAHTLGTAAYVLLGTALTFVCAACSWHFIEKPAIRFKYAGKAATH